MIVDPDFLDHWRTRMVVDLLSDEMGPLYIIRLWGHCQDRKADRFVMPVRGLKAQCRFQGDADLFEKTLCEAGFIQRDGDTVIVVGWAEKNASLIAAWGNGAKGGRPKSKPTTNPPETHGKPSGNPSLTQTEPIREEKTREEETRSDQSGETSDSISVLAPPTKARRRQQLPPDFYPNETGINAAGQKGINVAIELEKFRNYHQGKGSVMADWQAAWRTWVGNARPAMTQTRGKQLDPAWAAFYARSGSNVIDTEAKVIE